MRTAIASNVLIYFVFSGCAFAMARDQVERQLAMPIAGAGDDTFYSPGTQAVVAAGPVVIPILFEIVRDNRAASIAYSTTRSEENRRRLALRCEAISALGQLMHSSEEAVLIVPVLEAIARDREEFASPRSDALDALAWVGVPEGVDALVRLFREFQLTGDENRLAIISLLAKTPAPMGREALKEIAGIDDPVIQKELRYFLNAKPRAHPARPWATVAVKPGNSCGVSSLGESGLWLVLLLCVRGRPHA